MRKIEIQKQFRFANVNEWAKWEEKKKFNENWNIYIFLSGLCANGKITAGRTKIYFYELIQEVKCMGSYVAREKGRPQWKPAYTSIAQCESPPQNFTDENNWIQL